MIDLDTFINNEGKNKIFRMYKYRTIFTPYEQDKKYSDESIYENGSYPSYVRIIDAIKLPDGDVLLKLFDDLPEYEKYEGWEDRAAVYLYEKLSNIKLEEWEDDNKEE